MDIGVFGVGVMGKGLILNIESKGYSVSVCDRTPDKTQEFCAEHSNRRLKPCHDVESFVRSLKSPKRILVMILSGPPIDGIIEQLLPFVASEDVIVDGGNSFFEDTERRCRLHQGKFFFLGCGVSGGEEGARKGPSMMAGGHPEAWAQVEEIFASISARAGDQSCCAYLGSGGAGHFIKMVHNGIEYCEMEVLAEAYTLMKKSGLSNREIADVLERWLGNGFAGGYLAEISIQILARKDNVIDRIEDRASQKGSGMDCVLTGMKAGAPITEMCVAVFSRIISARKEKRDAFGSMLGTSELNEKIDVADLERAFVLAKSVAYVQGFNLIAACGQKYGWNFDLKKVCGVWKSGCILRGDFLGVMERMIDEVPIDFELSSPFVAICKENYESLKRTVKLGVDMETCIPSLSSSLCYINDLKTVAGRGGLIQALRDYFGSHTVRLLGEDQNVHIDW